MLLKHFIEDGSKALAELYPKEEARQLVFVLCEEMLGTKNYTHIVEPGYEINEQDTIALSRAMAELQNGKPIQYVLGFSEFCGLRFKVNPAVLIPRPETELLAREAIKAALLFGRPVRILDLCTGSGCLAWTLALNVPGAQVVAVDISEEALQVASNQDFSELLKERQASAPMFVKADVLDTVQDFGYGEFDIIVSNPPYILPSEKSQMRRNVLDFEPHLALFTPEDDAVLFYKAIAEWSKRFLVAGGKGFAEINENKAQEVEEVFRLDGFSDLQVVKDYYDKNRFIFYSK